MQSYISMPKKSMSDVAVLTDPEDATGGERERGRRWGRNGVVPVSGPDEIKGM